ncbi:MAG: succinyl-diaminopimelate desuccinylase [Gammaproteobacteria bacterium]|nr:succinyl-diaminopimelate desuccinylase [Gammaproteobacteria bacterium]
METLQLARQLIARQSVTPEDAGCQQVMIERLEALGFRIERLPFKDVSNFWAQYGNSRPLMVFAGHTDVVPAGPLEAWDSRPFQPDERGGLLYGRGAADMKGSLAAMITACESFLSTREPRGSLGFLITSDEEGDAVDGTVRVMEWLKQREIGIDYCLVGEPSSSHTLGDTIKIGRRGSLNGRLTVRGIQGHVAYPQLARNPIHQALVPLAELTSEPWDQGNDAFPPTSLQISNIDAGTGAVNVIPESAQVDFNLRFSTELTDQEIRDRCEEIFSNHDLDFRIDWQLSGQPFLTTGGALIEAACAAVKEHIGITPELSTSGGTSDGRFISPAGVEVIELGPCNASIHKVNEHVKVDDLETLSSLYRLILEKLL